MAAAVRRREARVIRSSASACSKDRTAGGVTCNFRAWSASDRPNASRTLLSQPAAGRVTRPIGRDRSVPWRICERSAGLAINV